MNVHFSRVDNSCTVYNSNGCVCLLVYNLLHGHAPLYLSDIYQLFAIAYHLRLRLWSTDTDVVRCHTLINIQQQKFPRLWNSLPSDIHGHCFWTATEELFVYDCCALCVCVCAEYKHSNNSNILFSALSCQLISNTGKPSHEFSVEARDASFLFQWCLVLVQHFNRDFWHWYTLAERLWTHFGRQKPKMFQNWKWFRFYRSNFLLLCSRLEPWLRELCCVVLCVVLTVTDEWVISSEERSKHDMLFLQQKPVGGYLSGLSAFFHLPAVLGDVAQCLMCDVVRLVSCHHCLYVLTVMLIKTLTLKAVKKKNYWMPWFNQDFPVLKTSTGAVILPFFCTVICIQW